jgi:hypothetical protein
MLIPEILHNKPFSAVDTVGFDRVGISCDAVKKEFAPSCVCQSLFFHNITETTPSDLTNIKGGGGKTPTIS